jgi:hypothetical protein
MRQEEKKTKSIEESIREVLEKTLSTPEIWQTLIQELRARRPSASRRDPLLITKSNLTARR